MGVKNCLVGFVLSCGGAGTVLRDCWVCVFGGTEREVLDGSSDRGVVAGKAITCGVLGVLLLLLLLCQG
jgi:hypothetical protein